MRCTGTAARAVASGRLNIARGAVETFGFHLATVDLRQNSAVHEQVVDEMLRIGGVCDDYLALWTRRDASRCCRPSWRNCATAAGRRLGGQRRCRERAGHPAAGGRDAANVRRSNAIENYIISKCESVSDVLEVARAVSRGRPAAIHRSIGRTRRPAPSGIVPLVRDHRRPAGCVRCRRCTVVASALSRMARPSRSTAGGHARVLRQQQGRRLHGVELGSVPVPGGPGRQSLGGTT